MVTASLSTDDAHERFRVLGEEAARLLDSVPSILIGLDRHRRITYWNDAAECVLGISSWNHATAFPPAEALPDAGHLAEAIDACLANKAARQLVQDVPCVAAGRRRALLRFTVASMEGPAPECQPERVRSAVLLIGSDVTMTRQAQVETAQAQKLQAIGQIAAGVAHEINTPAQYVGDNIRFLQEGCRDLLGLLRETVARPDRTGEVDTQYLMDEIPRAIDESLEGVDRITTIVKALKDFSHPGYEGQSTIDINAAIRTTIAVARNEWTQVAEMNTELEEELPLVPCYPGELNQVLLNLVVNAADAIKESISQGLGAKGTITVATRRDGEVVEVLVADTGVGIDAAIEARVFEPFFTTKPAGKGSGQGLALCHAIVVGQHHGSIHFEHLEPTGTAFIVRLPLRLVPRDAEPPA